MAWATCLARLTLMFFSIEGLGPGVDALVQCRATTKPEGGKNGRVEKTMSVGRHAGLLTHFACDCLH